MSLSPDELNLRTGIIIDAAMKVHTILGPGMLESAYQACLAYELQKRGRDVRSQVSIPLIYEQMRMEVGYRADMIIDNEILLELKAVESLARIHEVQLLSNLKMGGFESAC